MRFFEEEAGVFGAGLVGGECTCDLPRYGDVLGLAFADFFAGVSAARALLRVERPAIPYGTFAVHRSHLALYFDQKLDKMEWPKSLMTRSAGAGAPGVSLRRKAGTKHPSDHLQARFSG